ncbi:MAG: Hsp70 family protein [Candidatus Faecousia sp.]|nr:Hsp70 family protein [Bacillota bacterium]MDY4220152.1 Hsp70 family protein [Candidatus Faecousia sp.]
MLIGIDLGTTNSLAACFREGRAEMIPNRLGGFLTPSVVSVDPEGNVYVGQTAKERGLTHPLETASVFKRSMGTGREYRLGSKTFLPEELSSLVLRSLKEDAEVYLGEPVTEAIISVPAYFNDMQRKATKRAGELAGLTVSRIINEPTAAALAYGMAERGKDARYLVFDLGGGTFDVSILELYGSVMEVHAIAGDNFLGGEDFTELLMELYLRKAAVAPESLDLRTRGQIRKAAEACKCAFSEKATVTMTCEPDGKPVSMDLSLAEYEAACGPLLERLRRPIERSLRDARVSLSDIDEIVLVGGATRLPVVRRFVAKLFRRIPNALLDPDQAVALGAALQCGMKARNREIRETVLTDVCPFTLGTEVVMYNGSFDEPGHYLPIIERNTVIPVSRTHTVYTASDNQTRVNVKILQGESRLADNNLLLGELSLPVPPGPKGKESVDITYTYDVNALLEVEVLVSSTGARRKVIIQNEQNRLTDQEAEARLEALQYLKQSPRQEEANRLQLLRGERLYEETTALDRERIDRAITDFEAVLRRQDRTEIEHARKTLTKLLDEIEFGANG